MFWCFDCVSVPWWTSKRLLLSFICFVGFFFLYSLRVNISTAIVCMNKEDVPPTTASPNGNFSIIVINNGTDYNSTYPTYSNITMAPPPSTTVSPDACPVIESTTDLDPEFEWDKKLQGLILGAFFWGYTVMQIPSGYLSDVFGPRLMISLGMFPVAIVTIMLPFLARGSPYLLMTGRVLIGCGEVRLIKYRTLYNIKHIPLYVAAHAYKGNMSEWLGKCHLFA